jgi:hypothetical protein
LQYLEKLAHGHENSDWSEIRTRSAGLGIDWKIAASDKKNPGSENWTCDLANQRGTVPLGAMILSPETVVDSTYSIQCTAVVDNGQLKKLTFQKIF